MSFQCPTTVNQSKTDSSNDGKLLLFLPTGRNSSTADDERRVQQQFQGPSVSVLNMFGNSGEYTVNVQIPRMEVNQQGPASTQNGSTLGGWGFGQGQK